jgi:transcription elongation factor SPT5
MRRDSDRAIATDCEGHEIRVNDSMKETEGEVSSHNGMFGRYA